MQTEDWDLEAEAPSTPVMVDVPTVWLDARSATCLRNALRRREPSLEISLDLNLSTSCVHLPLGAPFPPSETDVEALLSKVLSSPRTAWLVRRGKPHRIEYRANRYLKLVPTAEAPTLEIDGIGMHVLDPRGLFQTLGKTIKQVVRRGDRVLDTCSVLSYEIDGAVLRLRVLSPWSAGLRDERLTVKRADVSEAVGSLREGCFEAVLHDPPRISVGGELYSLEFYRALARVLVPGGRLYHYTGQPFQRWRRKDIVGGVARRLREAGFTIKWSPEARGFFGRRTR
jgi:predicted methyltransferase